jgi:heterodisulfide reductase subunit D
MNLIKKIKNIFAGANTLYYPGCITKFVYKNLHKNYKIILNEIGIDYIELKNLEHCCGSPVINAGYKKDYEKLINHNKKIFTQSSVKKIITNCPACYKTLKENYPEIEIKHISETIFDAIKNKKLNIKNLKNEKITYHDPCHLGRHSGIYEEPRVILKNLGYKIIEMEKNRKDSLCCGAGAGLQNNHKEISNKIAKIRIKQAQETKTKKLITACPMCYHQLKKNSPKLKVIELSEVIINAIK